MSNMRFTHQKGTKSKGLYVVAALCLVAVGATAFFGIDSAFEPEGSTADNTSKPSVVSQPSYTYPDKDYGALDLPETPSKSEDKPTSSTAPQSQEQQAVETVTQAAGFFVLPVTGEIIKDFSDSELQYSLTYNDWRLHKGIDIKAPKGERINAAGDGTVTLIYDDGQYGKTIEINHGNDIVAIYSGLDEIMVEVGDVVAVNMQIATLGKVPCESVETAHLHLAIKKGDKYIAPLNIMGV